MPFIILLLFSALAVSSVAAYFSIVGLIAIFPSAEIPILLMGAVLEVAKLVTASWLYRNWNTAGVLLKTYFTSAVIILSIITSLGIFGFLSKAHIEHTITLGGDNAIQIENLTRRIENEKRSISDAQTAIETLDESVRILQDYDRIRGPEGALAVREGQKEERDELNSQINQAVETIETLQTELTPLRGEALAIEADIGPIKYIAELIYENPAESIDAAVRLIIMLLVIVFDPLAILLVIAANKSFKERSGEQVTFLDDSALTKDAPEYNIHTVDEEEFVEPTKTTEDILQEDNELLKKMAGGGSLNPSDRKRLKDLTWLIDSKNKGD